MASATAPLFAQQEKVCLSCRDQNQWEALPSGPFRQCHGQSDSVSASSKDEKATCTAENFAIVQSPSFQTDNVAITRYEVGEIVYWPPRHSFVIMYAQNGEMFDMQKIGKILSPLPTHWSGDVEIEITAGN